MLFSVFSRVLSWPHLLRWSSNQKKITRQTVLTIHEARKSKVQKLCTILRVANVFRRIVPAINFSISKMFTDKIGHAINVSLPPCLPQCSPPLASPPARVTRPTTPVLSKIVVLFRPLSVQFVFLPREVIVNSREIEACAYNRSEERTRRTAKFITITMQPPSEGQGPANSVFQQTKSAPQQINCPRTTAGKSKYPDFLLCAGSSRTGTFRLLSPTDKKVNNTCTAAQFSFPRRRGCLIFSLFWQNYCLGITFFDAHQTCDSPTFFGRHLQDCIGFATVRLTCRWSLGQLRWLYLNFWVVCYLTFWVLGTQIWVYRCT